MAVLAAISYVVVAVGATLGWSVAFFCAVAASYLADAALVHSRVPELLVRWQAPVTFRFLVRELALVILVVRAGVTMPADAHRQVGPHLVLLLVGLVLVHGVAATVGQLLDRVCVQRRAVIRSVNLVVAGGPAGGSSVAGPDPGGWVDDGAAGRRSVLHWDVASFAAVALVLPGAPFAGADWPLVAAIVVVAAGAAATAVSRVRSARRERSLGSVAERNAMTLAALDAIAPEVVVYFSSEPTSTYALNVWLETINRLERSTVIFLREPGHLRHLGPTRLPIVVAPDAAVVARLHRSAMVLALYPTSVVNNDDMRRLVGMRHVLIGHGDSDKAVTFSPLHRGFDETWVAGPAARDRYLRHDVGVRANQIRLVGRPPLAHIRPRSAAPQPPYTVLYAPTWEGNFEESDYSSVATMGVAIAAAVLGCAVPMRLLVKPHPATGRRDPRARRARAELQGMVTAAGAPHALVPAAPAALYDAFNSCDLLIADISSVIPDFLASGKPYLVTNPRRFDPDTLARDVPSAAGGFQVEPGLDGFERDLVASLTADPYAAPRAELAEYFLGPPVSDPIQHFVDLVSAAVDQQATRRAAARR